MKKSTIITLSVVAILLISAVTVGIMSININDEANTRLVGLKAFKSKVETKLDEMNKTISQQVQVTKGEKDAFLEFQALVADSKKGQTLGGIMTQVQEKYPNFEVKGFATIMRTIEVKRDEFARVQIQYNDQVAMYNRLIVRTTSRLLLFGSHVQQEQFVVSSKAAKKSMITGEDEPEELTF